MSYQSYADVNYYENEFGGQVLVDMDKNKYLRQASRHIDILTFNRIIGKGISSFTAFQQDLIRECCCEMAEFEFENQDMINSVLQSYSINGVSMSFGAGWNLMLFNGVAIRGDTYAKLSQTGLCGRTLRRCL